VSSVCCPANSDRKGNSAINNKLVHIKSSDLLGVWLAPFLKCVYTDRATPIKRIWQKSVVLVMIFLFWSNGPRPKHQITTLSCPIGWISTNEGIDRIDSRIEPISTAFRQSLTEKSGIFILKMH
jgi:hypothetical protein